MGTVVVAPRKPIPYQHGRGEQHRQQDDGQDAVSPAASQREREQRVAQIGERVQVREVGTDHERRHGERGPAPEPGFGQDRAGEGVTEIVHDEK